MEENKQQIEEQPAEQPAKQPEEQPVKELPAIVDEIKIEFENKLKNVVADYDKQIAERDKVIKQLINSDNTAVAVETVADIINKKRNFKKW